MKDFITTVTGKNNTLGDENADIVGYIVNELKTFSIARLTKEETWLECWAAYLGSPQSIEAMRSQMLRTVGDVNNDWRHRINVGKAFDNVETILAYLQQAFFPNQDWFDAVPLNPGYFELAEVVKKFTQKKLRESNFISNWEMFLRQLLITGNSCIALPWRYETTKWKTRVRVHSPTSKALGFGEKISYKTEEVEKIIQNAPDFETLDMFDVFISPQSCDPNRGNFIRRFYKTRAELAQCIRSGHYTGVTIDDIRGMKAGVRMYDTSQSNKDEVKYYQGLNVYSGRDNANWSDEIELFEFWGDVHLETKTYHDVRAVVCGAKLLRFETNPYWCGKPFVITNYIPIVRSSMGVGVIEPTLGMLHELNILTNSRLDNMSVSSDCMWEYLNDGTLQPDEMYTAPGKIFPVSQMGSIKPIEMPQAYVVTYEESQFLEQRIDKNTGTGTFVGVGQGRSGERVTAQEIIATRDAGGNRLAGVHKHIEETGLIVLLEKLFRQIQQFQSEDEIVRIPGAEPGEFDYVAVGVEELQNDFKLMPVGADHVVDKDYKLNKLLQFLQVCSQYPETKANLNYHNLQLEIARMLGLDEIERFVIEGYNPQPTPDNAGGQMGGTAPMQQPGGMGTGMDALNQELGKMGGQPMQHAVQGQLESDGGMDLMKNLAGIDNPSVPPPVPVQ